MDGGDCMSWNYQNNNLEGTSKVMADKYYDRIKEANNLKYNKVKEETKFSKEEVLEEVVEGEIEGSNVPDKE